MDDWSAAGAPVSDDWGSVGAPASTSGWDAVGSPASPAPSPRTALVPAETETLPDVAAPAVSRDLTPPSVPPAPGTPATVSLYPGGPQQQVSMQQPQMSPTDVQSVWQARLNAAPRGAIQSTGQIISGAGEALAGPTVQDTARGKLAVLDAVDAGQVLPASQDPNQIQQLTPDARKALRSTVEAAVKSGLQTPTDRMGQAVAGAGQAVSDFGQRMFPVAPENEHDLGVMVTGGMGSFAPLLAAGAVSGPLALPATAVAAGAQSYDAAYKAGIEQNPNRPDLAHQAASLSGLVGAGVMTLPVARFMSAAERMTGAPLAQTAMRMAGEGTTFTGIAQAQKLADNLIAGNTYDPNRSATEGLGDARDMAATTLTGAAMPLAMHAPGAIRRGVDAVTAPMMDPALRGGAEAMTDAAGRVNQTRPVTSDDLPNSRPDTTLLPGEIGGANEDSPGGPRPIPPGPDVGRAPAPDGPQNDNLEQGAPRDQPYRSSPSLSDTSAADWSPANDRLGQMGYAPEDIASMSPAIREAIANDAPRAPDGPPPTGSDAPISGGTFDERAGGVVSRLMSDLNLTKEQAAGVVGNLGHESVGLQAIQERNPTGGGRGGFGWAQWTGPRREAFEQFSRARGLDATDPEANYQFLVHELTGSESGALSKLRGAGTVEDATKVFQDAYERPGIAATGSRVAMARKAFNADVPDARPADAQAGPADQPQRVYAGNIGVDTTPLLMELSDLVASHDADGRVNPAYPHEDGIQPRDRSTVGSQAQVRDIASNLNPALLMPGPDASGGAPIVAPDGKTVENGNGRVAALSLAYSDPALSSRAEDYRAHLHAQGFDTTGMQQPVLVSRRDTPLAPDVRQQFIKATADRATLAMNSAERARADASLAGNSINQWQGQSAGSAANAPFVRSLMQGIPAAEQGALVNRDGSLSAAGEKRVQSAVTAHAYGDQLGPTLDRFAGDDAAGMKNISGALTDAAGTWAQMRAEAGKGMIPPALDITPDLAHAVQIVDQARQTGRPVSELLGQADFDRPISPMTDQLVRDFYSDPGMKRPAGRDKVGEKLRAYADEALKAQPGPDMFGSAPADAPAILRAASQHAQGGSARLLATRDGAAAHRATMADGDARTLAPEAIEARDRLRAAAQATMRFMGLPDGVGLRLVDRIIAGAHGADGSYTHGLIELALDTKPADLPGKLMHESVHALMDPKLGLLTTGQRDLLHTVADRWMKQGDNGEKLRALYGDDPALLREEAVARMGEEAFARGMKGAGPVRLAYDRMLNGARGIGQLLRGQGYKTADDVFRSLLTGERAAPGAREALQQFSPAIRATAASNAPASQQQSNETVPEGDGVSPPPLSDNTPGSMLPGDGTTAAAIRQYGATPQQYLSRRPVTQIKSNEIVAPGTPGRLKAIKDWAFANLRDKVFHSGALNADVKINRRGIEKPMSHASDDILSAYPAIPAMLRDGTLTRSEPPYNKDDRTTVAYHELSATISIDGRQVPFDLTVRQDQAGHFFYDLSSLRGSGDPQQVGGNPRAGGADSYREPPKPKIGDTDPDRKFAKRPRDDGPMLWDKAGLERAGQGALPGTERDELGALQRQADAPITAKVSQKTIADLPLFSGETKQSSLFGLRDNVTVALRDGSAEPRRKLNDMLNQALFPMRAGSAAAQVIASKFANALRGIDYRYGRIDHQLTREFTPEDRSAMGKALDAQSVFEQRIRSGDATEADRAAFDAGRSGLAGLPDKQRATVQSLDTLARQTWQRMVDRRMVEPGAEGLPYYMPRQFVMMDSLAGARRITGADNQIEAAKRDRDLPQAGDAGGVGGGLTAMDKIGGNLSTGGPKERNHLTAEDSTAAARAKFGDNVHLVTDVRSLLDALRRQEQSVAGRDLVNAIKEIGVQSGTDMVREGTAPGRGYFTLDHPSLWSVGPTGAEDANGKPIYGRIPMHIDEQFRGPLNAVLAKPNPDWYKALMAVKGRSMSAIMFSPAMHLMVEVGRSLPIYHGNPLALISSMRRAGTVLKDRGLMDQAIADGLAPIGASFGKLEATAIVNDAASLPATSTIGKLWGGDTKPQRAWHAMHQKALWDNILRLQTGIYNDMKARYVDKGFSPKAAGIMAAHLANRYAGALPPEQLSKAANMAANVSMFSRSFTLGNLAVMKDMLNGAPSHVKAALEAELGGEGADKAIKTLRRKAQAAFIMDVGMFYAINAVAQSGAALLRGQSLDQVGQDYVDHIFPQLGNEPGKEGRVYMGNDSAGTGIYGRMPFGKVGEEFLGWMPVIGHPGTMVQAKMNPLLRSTYEAISGRDSLGRSLYNPSPQGIADHLKIAGQAVMHIAASMTPADFVGQVYNAASGQARGDPGVTAARILGPMTGLSVSQGYPGGPQEGVQHDAMAHDAYEQLQARTEAKRLYAIGKPDDARDALDKAYANNPKGAASAWRSIITPERGQARFDRNFTKTAGDDARARAATVTGATR